MNIVAIAKIQGRYRGVIGFRLIDSVTGAIKDVDINILKSLMVENKIKVDNLGIETTLEVVGYKQERVYNIVGTNGAIDNLPTLRDGYCIYCENNVVILYHIKDKGYVVSNYLGQRATFTTNELIQYCSLGNKLCNGKIVSKQNKTYISPISGSFRLANIDEQSREKMEIREANSNKVASKMDMLRFPYRVVVGNGIKLLDKGIEKLNILRPVKVINDLAMFGLPNLWEVNFADTVRSIGYYAFAQCYKLVNVNLNDGLIAIGEKAFASCQTLANIKIPDTVTKIGRGAFDDCSYLHTINIPHGVEEIGARCFNGSGIKSIEVDCKVDELESEVFMACRKLSSVKLNNIKRINLNAFNRCINIKEIELNDGLEVLGGRVFSDCIILETVKLPKSLKELGYGEFIGCQSIIEIEIPEKVKVLPEDLFKNCYSLKKVKMPDTITDIKIGAFTGCRDLTEIKVPNSVTIIEDRVFKGCIQLKKVSLPDTITTINNRAFEGCNSLTEINIPKGLQKVDKEAFYGCSSLSKKVLNEFVKYME